MPAGVSRAKRDITGKQGGIFSSKKLTGTGSQENMEGLKSMSNQQKRIHETYGSYLKETNVVLSPALEQHKKPGSTFIQRLESVNTLNFSHTDIPVFTPNMQY